MNIWGLNTSYLSQYQPLLGGLNFPMPGGISAIPSVFSFAMPRYNVFNQNIFGFTPANNFCYMPFLDNNFTFMKPFNFMPQIVTPSLLNSTSPQTTSNNIFGFLNLTSTRKAKTSVEHKTEIHQETTTKTTEVRQSDTTTTEIKATKKKSKKQSNPKKTKTTSQNPTVNKALALAKSQIGVSEINGSNNSAEINEYRNGVQDGTPWCASFVSWCYGRGQNSNNGKTFGYSSSSQQIRRDAEIAGVYSSKTSGYKPKAGDLMVLKYAENSGHIGIVESINKDGSFNVIEGNMSNQVKRNRRTMNSEDLHGFVRMNEWLQA